MRQYARINDVDEEYWGFVGLIHDFDFEIHPTLDQHPQDGVPILLEEGVPEEVIQDVLSHADHSGVPRDTLIRQTLAAVDELSSFIVAVALVRPNKNVEEVKPKSVKKKMKDKGFARAVNRQEMIENADALGIKFDQHINNVVLGLSQVAPSLGLANNDVIYAESHDQN